MIYANTWEQRELQAEALLAILEGWEELFEAKKAELLLPSNEANQGDDWGDDAWNDGWETLQDLEPEEKEKKEYVVAAHPLHSCWLDIFKNTFLWVRSQCLSVVEDKLKQEGLPELSTTVSLFHLLSSWKAVSGVPRGADKRIRNKEANTSSERRLLSCFGELMFPCFISGLVKADQQILAGFLVTKFMHSNPSLSLINIAEASLRRYLERQLESLEDSFGETREVETLKNTVSSLRVNSKEVIRSALASLSSCTNSR
ncbi:hypothetical protein Bca52824_091787 [Brassica carinata]|uniref:Uncharacterized protein n=1 Tax=Brassica carinata TaxID=52824 RepID=A0A8X7NWJ8_BRACI|nr:hypothetical protein Bca52824_091787 [Brassica carinata]